MQLHCLSPLYRHGSFMSVSKTISLFSATSFRRSRHHSLQSLPGFLLSIIVPVKPLLDYLACALGLVVHNPLMFYTCQFALHILEARKIFTVPWHCILLKFLPCFFFFFLPWFFKDKTKHRNVLFFILPKYLYYD